MRVRGNGFTLIELMVTIAVLAIIAMMAVPSFNKLIHKNQLRYDAQQIVQLISGVRSEAILRKNTRDLSLLPTVTASYKNWQPSEHNLWLVAPAVTFQYNYFGYLVGDASCVILQHRKDSTLKAVIRINKNGSVIYRNNEIAC